MSDATDIVERARAVLWLDQTGLLKPLADEVERWRSGHRGEIEATDRMYRDLQAAAAERDAAQKALHLERHLRQELAAAVLRAGEAITETERERDYFKATSLNWPQVCEERDAAVDAIVELTRARQADRDEVERLSGRVEACTDHAHEEFAKLIRCQDERDAALMLLRRARPLIGVMPLGSADTELDDLRRAVDAALGGGE